VGLGRSCRYPAPWFGARVALVVGVVLLASCSAIPRTVETPTVRLLSLNLLEAGMSQQRFGLRLLVANPNAVALSIEGLGFEVRLAGEGILRGRSTAAFTLPASGQEIVAAEVTSDLVASVSRLIALLQGPADTLAYELTGELILPGSFRPPLHFHSRGEAPLTISGAGR
jgi:LEA14-like dessication related protein